MPVSGDLLTASVEHDELGSRVFEAKSGEDFIYDPGGRMSVDDDAMIGAQGTDIDQQQRKRWTAEFTIILTDGDVDFLQSIQQNTLPGSWTYSHISGRNRVGTGKIRGEIKANLQAGTISLKCSGGGTLAQLT